MRHLFFTIRNFFETQFYQYYNENCHGLFSQKFRKHIMGIRVHEVALNSQRPKSISDVRMMLLNKANTYIGP